MDVLRRSLNVRSAAAGYLAAVALPVGITYAVTWLGWPPFIFEHLIVLLVVAIATPWGLGPSIAAALVSVLADNVLLREPVGRPMITGYQDLFDWLLFAAVAVTVSELVRRARAARLAAEQAVARERRVREDRDRLIATVTHDLATPLAVLTGTAQFVKRHRSVAEDDLLRLTRRLETASARAAALVRTLAEAQAFDSEEVALRTETHDLRRLVHPIVEMMDRFSEQHPVVLDAPDDPVTVTVDGDRVQRVLENLINNAIKYSPEGGAVEVSISSDGEYAVLTVRDFGIGISPAVLPRIFEAFYRAPEAVSCAPGLGLGLSIAAQVIARHEGTIEAAPADERGTRVTVRLPLVARGRAAWTAAAGRSTPPSCLQA